MSAWFAFCVIIWFVCVSSQELACNRNVTGHLATYDTQYFQGDAHESDSYYFHIDGTTPLIIDGCESLNDYYLHLNKLKYNATTNEWELIASDGGYFNSTCKQFKGILNLPNVTSGAYQITIETNLYTGALHTDYILKMTCFNGTNTTQSVSQTVTAKLNDMFIIIQDNMIYNSYSLSDHSNINFFANITRDGKYSLNCDGQCWTQSFSLLYFIHHHTSSTMLIIMNFNAIFNKWLYGEEHVLANYTLFEDDWNDYDGGYCMANNGSHVFIVIAKSFYIWDISENTLEQGPSLHITRYYAGCNFADDSVFVFGGFTSIHYSTFVPKCPTFSIEKYDMNQHKWIVSNASVLKVMRGELFVIKDDDNHLFYILNGYDHFDGLVPYIEVFDYEKELMIDVLYKDNSTVVGGPLFDSDTDSIYLFDIRQTLNGTDISSNIISVKKDIFNYRDYDLQAIEIDPFYTLFVDYCGDNDPHLECGSLTNPCASLSVMMEYLSFQVEIMSLYPIAMPTAHIYIASPTNAVYSNDDCFFALKRANIIITFNPITISSTNQWFPSFKNCMSETHQYINQTEGSYRVQSIFNFYQFFDSGLPTFLTLNNMIWDYDMEDVAIPLIQNSIDSYQYFFCNNCRFLNIHTESTPFFKTQHGIFDTCQFYNISTSESASFLLSGSFEIDIPNEYELVFDECNFINISSTSNSFIEFVSLSDRAVDSQPFITINDCYILADQLAIFISDESSLTQITSSTFIGDIMIINGGQSEIQIVDSYIEQWRYFHTRYYDYDTLYYPSIKTESRSILEIQNVSIVFHTECYSNFYYYQIGIYCESPMTLLHNSGIAKLHNVSFKTEYAKDEWIQYKQRMYSNLGLYYGPSLGSYSQYFCALLNYGYLSVDNLYIHQGAHYNIICDYGVYLNINNMQTAWYREPSLFYDKFALKPVGFMHFQGQFCSITNSTITGFSVYAISLSGYQQSGMGSFEIHNCIISLSAAAIQSINPFMSSIILDNVTIYDVGFYYSLINARRFVYSFSVPLLLSAEVINITNCIFKYISLQGILMIDSVGISQHYTSQQSGNRQVYISGCIFNVDGHYNDSWIVEFYDIDESTPAQPERDGAMKYQNLQDWWYANDVDSKEFEIHEEGIPGPDGIVFNTFDIIEPEDGIVFISGNNTRVVFVNNELTFNGEKIAYHYRFWPFIYFDTAATENCLSSNIISNYALYLKQGTIKSCSHPFTDTLAQEEGCWDWYGARKEEYGGNTFLIQYAFFDKGNHSQIVMDSITSYLILDDVSFINGINRSNGSMIKINYGNLSVIESQMIEFNDGLSFDEGICDVSCHQIINHNRSNIRQYHMECYPNASQSKAAIESFEYGFPSDVLLRSSGELSPGGWIDIEFLLMDPFGINVITAAGDDDDGISVTVILISDPSELNINTRITIDEWPYYHKIYVQSATISMIGNTYIINAFVKDDMMTINDVNITIVGCSIGFGTIGNQSQCSQCPKGSFSMNINNGTCYECDAVDGVTCDGGSNIIVQYQYWMNIVRLTNDSDVSYGIVSALCSDSRCCQNLNGCPFEYQYTDEVGGYALVNADTHQLCALHRDVDVYLCGQCLPAFSEAFGTSQCKLCTQHYWQRFLIPISFGFIWFVYIILSKSDKLESDDDDDDASNCCLCCCESEGQTDDQQDNEKALMTRSQFTNSVEVMVTKVMLYYYQSVSYLTIQATELIGYAALFNLDILNGFSYNDDEFDGYCLISQMSMPQKIFMPLTVTATIIILIYIVWMFDLCKINCLKICTRKPNFGQVIIKTVLICIGQIFAVLFQFLACRTFANGATVHYFFGSHECFGWRWWIAFVALLVCVIMFCSLFLVVRKRRITLREESKQNHQEIDEEREYYWPIIWCYNTDYWYTTYWELFLFFRRLYLSLILIVVESNDLKLVSALLLGIYLFCHAITQPFISTHVNILESLLIGSIVMAIMMDAVYQTNVLNRTGTVIIYVLILYPVAWVLGYVFLNCKALCRADAEDDNNYQNIKNTDLGDSDDAVLDGIMHETFQTSIMSEEEEQSVGSNVANRGSIFSARTAGNQTIELISNEIVDGNCNSD
eukprot:753003_1